MNLHRTLLLVAWTAFAVCGCENPVDPPPSPNGNAAQSDTTEADAADGTGDRSEDPAGTDSEECRLVMGWDPWEPYHFAGAGGRIQGLDVELARAIADHAECELGFLQGNWASLLRLIRLGELDLLTGATRTPEREEFARFTGPYRDEEFVVHVRAEEVRRHADQTLEELLAGGFRLGVTQGYIYGPEITELQAEYPEQFIEAAVGELNFTNLLDHRIDGFLESPYVAAAIQRRRGDAERVRALDRVEAGGPVHLMLSRESVSAERAAAINDSLEALEAEGTLQEIRDRYLP